MFVIGILCGMEIGLEIGLLTTDEMRKETAKRI